MVLTNNTHGQAFLLLRARQRDRTRLLDDERTGLHVTLAEMEAWAKSLGTRKPRRFPKWHK